MPLTGCGTNEPERTCWGLFTTGAVLRERTVAKPMSRSKSTNVLETHFRGIRGLSMTNPRSLP